MKKILITILLSSFLFPVGEAGAIYLTIPSSPIMNGLGGIGACLPSDDPYSSFFNPANGIGIGNGIYLSNSQLHSQWLRNLAVDLYIDSDVLNFGINFKRYPISIFLTSSDFELDIGDQIRTDEYGNEISLINTSMIMNAITIGMRYSNRFGKIPLDISFGYTKKKSLQEFIEQSFIDPTLEAGYYISNEKLHDYGLLGSVPLSFPLWFNNNQSGFLQKLRGHIIPSFGYSVSNIADSITFNDHDQGDPAPKFLRTGLSAIFAVTYNNDINIVRWSGGRMASDMMINMDQLRKGKIKYQSGFADVDFMNHVIRSDADTLVTIHRGDELTFFDLYSIRSGRKIDLGGRIDLHTSGYGYRLSGMLKILYYISHNNAVKILQNHLDIQYNYAKWEAETGSPLQGTEFETWSITISSIDQLILRIIDK